MTDSPNTLATANAMLKIIYSTDIAKAVSSVNKFQKLVPFKLSETGLGQKYHMPFLGSREQGITFSASDNVTLNPANAPTLQFAELVGYTIAVNSMVTQKVIDSTASGRQAFEPIMDLIMENVIMAGSKNTECSIIHGRNGWMDVVSTSNVSTTETTLQAASMWASNMWTGEVGKNLDLYHTVTISNGTLSGTQLNTNAPLVIVSVDHDAKTLTVSSTSTADIAAIDTYFASYADGFLIPEGSFNQDMVGLRAIQQNTTDLFGIDASSYDLWKANTIDVGGAFTSKVLNDAIAKAVNVGGLDTDVKVFLNPSTWASLMDTALTAQRRFDDSYDRKLVINGTENLQFYSQAGALDIVPHPYVFEADAHILPVEQLVRVGASDLKLLTTQGTEGNGTGNLLFPISGTLNYELRAYTDQSILMREPAKSVFCYGIVNS